MLRAKLFWNGSSQAVRLPKECRFAGKEVLVKPMGRAVLLIPVQGAWDILRESLDASREKGAVQSQVGPIMPPPG